MLIISKNYGNILHVCYLILLTIFHGRYSYSIDGFGITEMKVKIPAQPLTNM